MSFEVCLMFELTYLKGNVGQLRGGVNQLLLCLNNYTHFKLFTEHSITITMIQGSKH
jgi:hypothetical protein